MSDPRINPYAPPGSVSAAVVVDDGDARAPSDYRGERRNVLLMILLWVVTLGVYAGIWYVRRARFFDGLDASKKLGLLPWLSVALLAFLLLASAAGAERDLIRLIEAASGLTNLFLAFRMAAILRSDFARTGRFIGFSSFGVFFFGCLYLQHVMNEAAEVPARGRRSAVQSP